MSQAALRAGVAPRGQAGTRHSPCTPSSCRIPVCGPSHLLRTGLAPGPTPPLATWARGPGPQASGSARSSPASCFGRGGFRLSAPAPRDRCDPRKGLAGRNWVRGGAAGLARAAGPPPGKPPCPAPRERDPLAREQAATRVPACICLILPVDPPGQCPPAPCQDQARAWSVSRSPHLSACFACGQPECKCPLQRAGRAGTRGRQRALARPGGRPLPGGGPGCGCSWGCSEQAQAGCPAADAGSCNGSTVLTFLETVLCPGLRRGGADK